MFAEANSVVFGRRNTSLVTLKLFGRRDSVGDFDFSWNLRDFLVGALLGLNISAVLNLVRS